MTRISRRALLASALPLVAAPVFAQDRYPSRPINLIVPFAPGGSTDLLARLMRQYATRHLGQDIVVFNKPGAGATLGWNDVVTAAPDGYTLGAVTSSAAIRPVYGDTRFNYITALEPIAWVSTIPQVLAVRAEAPWKTIDDLVRYARDNPGKFTYGHSGVGNSSHVAMEALALKAGVKWLPVPYNSGSQVLSALLGGQIDATVATPVEFSSHLAAGKIRVLAVFDEKRFDAPLFRDIPTFAEKGWPIDSLSWNGVAAPKGLPPAIRKHLVDGFRAIAAEPEFVASATKAGLAITYAGPEAFGAKWKSDQETFLKQATDTGILQLVKSQK
ncbi:tripartite tricarboxylate transporter substrate binding protein [Ramlibacter sp. G-1-2-2]|uniref:Tripartite tricarboxylate transporter substrate binding protein n=1 Tax=Ramlibacter agri TaxID=2728837 RepID=A0A848H8P7_9BURK|nr:tripartite tricarboxylate transporter substrate binding protein [Ramlibacter agri]NML44913.1 tripartite tricarboxylate transporter substrate binding protein [Ramlibacter agri]